MSEQNNKCAFIPDGYTTNAFIKETDLHPAARFVYRPITIMERSMVNGMVVFNSELNTEEGFAETEKIAAKSIVSHLVEWDVKDPDGKSVELNAENALKLNPVLFNRIYNVVMGMSVSDPIKPDDKKEEPEPENAEKNSVAG